MTTNKDQGPNAPGADDLAARATEQMLAPNPFTGLRKEDILATVQELAGQAAVKTPMLVLEQEAVLARELIGWPERSRRPARGRSTGASG